MIGNVKVTAAPSFRSSSSHSSGMPFHSESLVANEGLGVVAWCEHPPSLAQLTRTDCSFILSHDWVTMG